MKQNRFFLALALIVVLAMVIGGCGGGNRTAREKQQTAKLNNVDRLITNQPSTPLDYSMDRYLIDQRNKRFNDPNKINYLYIVMADGTWLKVTIIGKMASTSKRLSSPVEVNSWSNGYYTVPAPDDMGVWGESVGAHLGMTTLGSLLECGGFLSYIYSEVPLMFQDFNKPMVTITASVTPEERAELAKKLDELKANVKQGGAR